MRFAVLMAVAVLVAGQAAAVRPPVDKAGLVKTAWVQLNPWFPVDMAPVYDLGGPNIPYATCRGTNSWLEALRTVSRYGIDGVLPEFNVPGGYPTVYRQLLDSAPLVGRSMRVGLFSGFYAKTPEEAGAAAVSMLKPFLEDLRSNPHVARAGRRPIWLIYTPLRYKPEEWARIFSAIEAELGEFCFLFSYSQFTGSLGPDKLEESLRAYLPVFDGVSAYNFSMDGIQVQRTEVKVVSRVMRDFPGKLFEGGIFSTYTQHFDMAGLEVHLSRDFRESVRLWLAANPDAVEITNLFDHYENSLVYPCYEREDLLLRYLDYELCRWRGRPFARTKEPELVLCNQTSALLGWTRLDLEVLGFPIDGEAREVSVTVDICNTAGKVLKTFGPQKLVLDEFREWQLSVPSTEFLNERGIVPRLTYVWKGETRRLPHNPMTFLSPSIRPHRMYWARSTRNAAKVTGSGNWTLDGVPPGGTRLPRRGGMAVVTGDLRSRNYLRHGLKRDGVEEYFTTDRNRQGRMQMALKLPDPGAALHWYHLEIQEPDGRKFQTLPVWETGGLQKGTKDVPILFEDGSVRTCAIESVRIPFFYWPCDRDDGRLLIDISGYEHNAHVDGAGYGGGHLGYTGYNLCHNGPVQVDEKWESPFRRDSDGKGYLRLAGRHYVVSMGGSAMPAASTYELTVRPSSFGRRMGLLCGRWGSIVMTLDAEGRVSVERRSDQFLFKTDTCILSKAPLALGTWSKLAVTYDLRMMRLYVNGELQAEAPVKPNRYDKSWGSKDWNYCTHEFNNELFIGAEDDNLKPTNVFDGDIRRIRIYGRNLSPEEFL